MDEPIIDNYINNEFYFKNWTGKVDNDVIRSKVLKHEIDFKRIEDNIIFF